MSTNFTLNLRRIKQMIRRYEINTSDPEVMLNFAVKHNDCAVTFKKMDFKNMEFVAVAEEV